MHILTPYAKKLLEANPQTCRVQVGGLSVDLVRATPAELAALAEASPLLVIPKPKRKPRKKTVPKDS